MPMKFTGDFVVRKSREEVYAFLIDPNRFAPLLPEYQGMTTEDGRNFTVKLNVGVSSIRGTAEVRLNLDQANPPTFALYKGQGKLPGGSASVSAGFDLAEAPEGTKVSWTGEAQVFGKLTSLAGGLLEPLAKKNIQKLIDGLKTALS
jgi:carbon monoxide dehydrogenase subunit G